MLGQLKDTLVPSQGSVSHEGVQGLLQRRDPK